MVTSRIELKQLLQPKTATKKASELRLHQFRDSSETKGNQSTSSKNKLDLVIELVPEVVF